MKIIDVQTLTADFRTL